MGMVSVHAHLTAHVCVCTRVCTHMYVFMHTCQTFVNLGRPTHCGQCFCGGTGRVVVFLFFLLLGPGATNPGKPSPMPARGPLPHRTFWRHCCKQEVSTGLGRWPHPIAGLSLHAPHYIRRAEQVMRPFHCLTRAREFV